MSSSNLSTTSTSALFRAHKKNCRKCAGFTTPEAGMRKDNSILSPLKEHESQMDFFDDRIDECQEFKTLLSKTQSGGNGRGRNIIPAAFFRRYEPLGEVQLIE